MADIPNPLGLFFFMFAIVQDISGELIPAVVGESVNITAHVTCPTQVTLILQRKHGSPVTVASFDNGVWVPEEAYRDRIETSASGILLTRVNYNDKGLYVLSCGGEDVSRFDLEVLVISNNNISVTEGDREKLPCHASTLDEPLTSVWWEKNKRFVLKLNASNGEIAYDPGFDGRASLSSDWKSKGDLSLTLDGVQLDDKGDYSCFVLRNERKNRGNPALVRLTVLRKTNSSSSPPVSEKPKQDTGKEQTLPWIIAFGVTLALLLLLLLVCLGVFLWRHYCRSGSSPRPGAAGASTHVDGGLPPSLAAVHRNGIEMNAIY